MLCAVAFKVVSDAFWAYLFVLYVPYKLPRTTPLLPHPFPPISLFFSPSLPGSRAESSGTLAKSCGTGVSMGSHMRARCHGDHCVQGQGFINTAAAVSSPPLITSSSVLSIPPSWPLLVPFVHLFPSSSSSHPPPLVLPLLVMVCSFLPILYSFFARSWQFTCRYSCLCM